MEVALTEVAKTDQATEIAEKRQLVPLGDTSRTREFLAKICWPRPGILPGSYDRDQGDAHAAVTGGAGAAR
eukprot:4394351-Prymnesium_polylepis.1